MARKFSEKKRNSSARSRKPVILIIAEGRNVTETQYFKQFQRQYSPYTIKPLAPGSVTDPKKMLDAIERYWKQFDLSYSDGDRAYVVLDLDCSEQKARLIEKLEKESETARFIVSNPCFEVWYLLHYQYSTHAYSDGNEVIRDLKKYIPDYKKSTNVFPKLSGLLDTAIVNSRKLKEFYDEMGSKWPSSECNPRTDVPEIINEIKKKRGDIS